MFKKYLEKVRRPGQEVNPLLEFIGIGIDHLSEEKAILILPLRREFLQGAGVVGGGILATLADEAMGHIVAANLTDEQTAATIEMNITYLKSVTSGEIRAEASLVKKGRSIISLQSDILNESGELVAKASGSFLIINKE
jgi:uncharacterized protein (TIGR00369 family)